MIYVFIYLSEYISELPGIWKAQFEKHAIEEVGGERGMGVPNLLMCSAERARNTRDVLCWQAVRAIHCDRQQTTYLCLSILVIVPFVESKKREPVQVEKSQGWTEKIMEGSIKRGEIRWIAKPWKFGNLGSKGRNGRITVTEPGHSRIWCEKVEIREDSIMDEEKLPGSMTNTSKWYIS